VYEHTTVFVNDYPAVLPPPGPIAPVSPHPLLTAQPVDGQCDVITFHPRHDLTLARLGIEDISRIVEEWTAIYKRRGTQEGIRYVQIFEVSIFLRLVHILLAKFVQNKGAIMGCSNPHPHGQVWSLTEIPTIASVELASLARYAVNLGIPTSQAPRGPFGRPCLLCEYVGFELSVVESESRVVVKNEHFVALVSWWATWPFEILCTFVYTTYCIY
jgi:UDPglucose--hexose-1-phosphate uridylyltransferase